MYTDREFANQVNKTRDDKDFSDFVAKEGYDFSAEELKEVDQEFRKKVSSELSEAELSIVVGGGATMFFPCEPGDTRLRCQPTDK